MKVNLFNGDCIEVMKSFADNSIDLILTDPPYGVTRCNWDSVIPLDKMWFELHRIKKDTTPIILFATQPFTSVIICSNIEKFRYSLVWEKSISTGFLNAKKMPLRSHEDIIVFYDNLPTYNPQMSTDHKRKVATRSSVNTNIYNPANNMAHYDSTERYPKSVMCFGKDMYSPNLHPTQKPIKLMEYLVQTYSNANDVVLDFTMGSGTTGVAAKKYDRNFVGIEFDEKYFSAAKKRINSTITLSDFISF